MQDKTDAISALTNLIDVIASFADQEDYQPPEIFVLDRGISLF